MPDEHDDEPGPGGPHRPSHPRRSTYRTESPGVGGNTTHDQKAQPRETPHEVPLASRPDPRFQNAPMTDAEKKELHQARDLDEVCALLGQMQEARHKDGRLPPPTPRTDKPAPLINQYMSEQEQIALGLKPTAEQLAYLQAATSPEEEKDRTAAYRAERKAQNSAWYERSRHWGPELDRQAHASEPQYDLRIRGSHRNQAWRSEIAELRKAALRAAHDQVPSVFARQSSSPDPRFANAPITASEEQALRAAPNPEAANQLLGQMQEARLKDAPASQAAHLHPGDALINQALSVQEQIRLGLKPTAQELSYLQAGAIRGQEFDRTTEFIAQRHARNDRLFDETRENANQQKARDYWEQRRENSTASAQREARTEKAERRTDLQQLRAAMRERREQAAENEGNQGRQGRDQGGRER
jgi:hypothetical protein